MLSDKRKFLKKYKAVELKKFLKEKEIDRGTYNEFVQTVDKDCMSDVGMVDFILSAGSIKFHDPCVFSSAAGHGYEPDYELTYSYKFLYPYLKPEFQKRLIR